MLLTAEILAIRDPRFWESCVSRVSILCRKAVQAILALSLFHGRFSGEAAF